MKLTHHDDGTFSLTGMTPDEARKFATALGAQEAHEARLSEGIGAWSGFTQRDARFFAAEWRKTERLRQWLEAAVRWGDGIRRRSSTTFVEVRPVRESGVDRCPCGSKYWTPDGRCIDCGGTEVEAA